MSIGINTNYGTNGYVGLNSSAEPAWIKDDDKEKEKASSAAQPGVIYEKQDANAKAVKSEKGFHFVRKNERSSADNDIMRNVKRSTNSKPHDKRRAACLGHIYGEPWVSPS